MTKASKYRIAIIFFALSLGSCASHQQETPKVQIHEALSYSIDVDQQIFTTHYLSKRDSNAYFSLTEQERKQINQKYSDLNLSEFPNILQIKDECDEEPSFSTRLVVQTKQTTFDIRIDTGCDQFIEEHQKYAERVKRFLSFIYSILNKKPEIQNARNSNLYYK
jgi:hypothetical protein